MQIKRYILTSHNDGSGDSLRAQCFETHAEAFTHMVSEAMEIATSTGDVDDLFELDHVISASGLCFEFFGVVYEWSISVSLIDLNARERREAYNELEEQNILEDINDLIFDRECGYVLDGIDKQQVRCRFCAKHD